MKATKFSLVSTIALFTFIQLAQAQEITPEKLNEKLEKKEFQFVATQALPLRGTSKYLNTPYDVQIKKDSITSFLPYFGVSRSAPILSDDAGIKITSTKFKYLLTKKNKDSRAVQIEFNDQNEVREFNFVIFDDGNATLDVTGNNRDPISFRGFIK